MASRATVTLYPAFAFERAFGDDTQSFSPSTGYGSSPWSLTQGTGASQFTKLYAVKHTLGSSATVDLDLAGDSSFKDPFEQPITFSLVRGIWVFAHAANAHAINVGPAASNGFMGPWINAGVQQAIQPGQPFAQLCLTAAGWPVTAGTGDLFRLTNAGATAGQAAYVMLWGN